MLSEMTISRLFIFYYLYVMSLHGKLAAVSSCWLLIFFFLKSNDDLDVVLSTDLGEQLLPVVLGVHGNIISILYLLTLCL